MKTAILGAYVDAQSVEIRSKGDVIGEGWGSWMKGNYINSADATGGLTFLLKAKKGVKKIRSPNDIAALKYDEKFVAMIHWPTDEDPRSERAVWSYLRDDHGAANEKMPEDHLAEEAKMAYAPFILLSPILTRLTAQRGSNSPSPVARIFPR